MYYNVSFFSRLGAVLGDNAINIGRDSYKVLAARKICCAMQNDRHPASDNHFRIDYFHYLNCA